MFRENESKSAHKYEDVFYFVCESTTSMLAQAKICFVRYKLDCLIVDITVV